MNIAIILAAGSGTRMGNASKPKQFLMIYNKPLIVHTIEAFEMHDEIDYLLVVTNKEYIDEVKVYTKQFDLSKVRYIIEGGASRQESVYKAIMFLKGLNIDDDDNIIIHDAARPLISQNIISDNVKACSTFGAVDTVIPSSDTIIRSIDNATIDSIAKRSELFLGQTPQSFKFKIILEAHEHAKRVGNNLATDDCRLVLDIGKKIHLVNGSKLNFKITTFDDLMILKALLKLGKSEVI